MMAFVIEVIRIVIIFSVIMGVVAYMTLAERRLLAFFQVRLGPNRVGPAGLLQPIADGIKLFFKEDMTVRHAHAFYFILAPMVSLVAVLACFAVVPFTAKIFITDMSVAVLYLMAVSSAGVYGILLAGWSSNSTYSMLGGYRAAAQIISYEIPMALAVAGVLIMSGSMSIVEIVNSQEGLWNIIRQPVGFLVFLTCVFAETHRTPFDLLECENELVAGYQTEYSSMKFALFYMAEYAHVLLASCLVTVFFLGGWNGPVLPALVWFALKVFLVFFFFVWVRATWPRLRYDHLMDVSWKVMLPVAFANVMVTAFIVVMAG
ncbi:MAG: NADH-quinone oxidoreductase subunit NuoH [Syntrophales bacterium]|jgi:NADH-quinone oxidoreductase subunit H|nr:NADH-quinone oxidoreductase subunit NuoH [Syntrophales bacterium]MCK9527233.1 NADH-quinone oxidoreductase subunit NuoH [Syntrophales bacterium]MDX9921297.1 NADH-quinone oxidoreductase subunit NuoH [Syntrophales bacterium]